MGTTLIKNARVLDCTGQAPYRADVTVRENRIEDISSSIGGSYSSASSAYGSSGSTSNGYSSASTVIDANGMTLMPGLIESHSHFSYPDLERIEQVGEIPPEEHMMLTYKNTQTMIDAGFTSLFSAASARKRTDIVARNMINKGVFKGPRIKAASPEMTPTAGLGDVNMEHMDRYSFSIVCDGADEYRKVSREMVREGVDVLKMNPSGDEFVPHADGQTTVMTEEEIAAVCEIGHIHGKMIAAHARSSLSVKLCLKHGVQVIYHANYADEEALAMLESAKDSIFVAPAFGLAIATLEDAAPWGITRETAISFGVQDQLDGAIINMKKLIQRGVRVLPGGDYGFAWNPVGNNARDIGHFVKHLDMSPMDAIMSATKSGGEIMGMGDELGQVKKGYLADLILVEGDPLTDINILADKARIKCVMKDGEVLKMAIPERGNANGIR